jgi:hypothetical protein
MPTRSRPAIVAVSLAVAVAAGIASAIGVFARGDGTFETVTSVRGETYAMATSGVYAFNAQRVVAEGVGWDVFTLAIAVPATLLAAVLVAHGSLRGRLAVAGLFGYFLYQYLEYAVTWAFGPLFLLFVAIYAASLLGIGLVVLDVAREGVPTRSGAGFPRRSYPVLLVAMSVLLTTLWLQRIVAGLVDGVDGLLLGETTMTVQALDLGLVVPATVVVAVMAWRAGSIGRVVTASYAVVFTAMSAAITCMLVSAWLVEGTAEVVPIAIFGLATAASVWLGLRIGRSLGSDVEQTRTDMSSAAAVAPTA